ncbi:MAG: hypothetical protein IPL58_13440 [Betaproteobacteria bacterium]|uniref:Uncharacterized protein n=1 Tax=Candidatus Proximibacter danicus TaxID=2954365 RepID=A0A9D7PR83_9PROT|nr:hypothetical protein [Candidatus Proximibacter danicus]
MPTNNLWAGVLSQLLIHQETGCPHSARHAIRLLDQLCEFADLDADVRALCERASQRLGQPMTSVHHVAKERCHARPA